MDSLERGKGDIQGPGLQDTWAMVRMELSPEDWGTKEELEAGQFHHQVCPLNHHSGY